MIIYSVTYAIEDRIESEWITFMKEHHLPQLMNSGHFEDYTFSKIRAQEKTDTAFNLQLKFLNEARLKTYLSDFQRELEQAMHAKYQGRYASFSTILEEM